MPDWSDIYVEKVIGNSAQLHFCKVLIIHNHFGVIFKKGNKPMKLKINFKEFFHFLLF